MPRAQAELSGSGAASVKQHLHATRAGAGAGAQGQLRVSDENAVPSLQLLSAGPHLRLQGQIGHRRLLGEGGAPSSGMPQVFCGFTSDTVCELKLPDHQCRKPRSIPVDSILLVICVLRRVLCDFFQATGTQGHTE